MAGHSKFANIKHRKERMDAAKGKIFTKLGREIAVAVKSGGPDPTANVTLKTVIAKAKAENMPNDTIDRSIKKASGDLAAVNFEHVTYEGYGPSGVAVIVEALSDNRNRTAATVRNAFTKGGGNVGQMGCVSYMFTKQGVVLIENNQLGGNTADDLMEIALDLGARDFIAAEDGIEIITDDDEGVLSNINDKLAALGVSPASSEMSLVPANYVSLTDAEDIKKMTKLLDLLNDEDDVTNVYHNWEQ